MRPYRSLQVLQDFRGMILLALGVIRRSGIEDVRKDLAGQLRGIAALKSRRSDSSTFRTESRSSVFIQANFAATPLITVRHQIISFDFPPESASSQSA